MELKNDMRRLTFSDAKLMVESILKKYYLAELDLNNEKMAKFFLEKFLDMGIKVKHIEKIFGVGHGRLKRILEN